MTNLPEGIRTCDLTTEHLHEVWIKIKDFDKLFSDEVDWNELGFCRRIMHSSTIVLEVDEGIIILDNIKNGSFSSICFCFWDRKLSTKISLIKECLVWAFLTFKLERIEAIVPDFCRALRRFIEQRLGFTYEGRLRNRMNYKDSFSDVLMFSILRTEV